MMNMKKKFDRVVELLEQLGPPECMIVDSITGITNKIYLVKRVEEKKNVFGNVVKNLVYLDQYIVRAEKIGSDLIGSQDMRGKDHE